MINSVRNICYNKIQIVFILQKERIGFFFKFFILLLNITNITSRIILKYIFYQNSVLNK